MRAGLGGPASAGGRPGAAATAGGAPPARRCRGRHRDAPRCGSSGNPGTAAPGPGGSPPGGWPCLQQRQVQPLEPAVLLGLARRDALGDHPGLDRQDREPRQPARAGRREGWLVIRAEPERQPVFPEGSVEDRPDMLRVGPSHRLAAQQIPAAGVSVSQRIPSPVRNQPLKSIARTSFGASAAKSAAPGGARRRQPLSREELADRARRRPASAGMRAHQRRPDLHRPHRGCRRRSARQASIGSGATARGLPRGARDRSNRPALPSARQRRSQR